MHLTHQTNKIVSIISVLLYLAGALLIGFMSVRILWGELEATTYFPFNDSASLKMTCPLVLSETETGTIHATVLNSIKDPTKPMVNASLSSAQGSQNMSQILELAPGQSRTLEWQVERANIVFESLILVNINQYRYANLDSRRGACGIMVMSLFGLPGIWSLGLVLAFGLLLLVGGAVLWIRNHAELDEYSIKVIRIGRLFAIFIIAGMATAAFRWWGLILLFDFMAIVTLTVAFTDTLLVPTS